jgi:hypothetical protein
MHLEGRVSFVGHPLVHLRDFLSMLLRPRYWHCGYEAESGRSIIGGEFNWCNGPSWHLWVGPFWVGLSQGNPKPSWIPSALVSTLFLAFAGCGAYALLW